MGKLVEATHATLGGEVGTNDWAFPYLDEQHSHYNMELLSRADALLLGRQTYEHLSVAYTKMVERHRHRRRCRLIRRRSQTQRRPESLEVRKRAARRHPDGTRADRRIPPYLTPVAIGAGQHLFESIDTAPLLRLVDVTRFDSGVLILVYAPK